jgi:hypothetical protein
MPTYPTLDYLPDLSTTEMLGAKPLTFTPYTPSYSGIAWDNSAFYSTSQDYAILYDDFYFTGKAGATYDVYSSSFFDPFILRVFDNLGNTIAVDDNTGTYGTDHTEFVAPYSGRYYLTASWNQGSYYKYSSISVYEDVDTAVPAKNYISGTFTSDRFIATDASDIINGGDGVDFVTYKGLRSNYTVTKIDNTYVVAPISGTGGRDTLASVERLIFDDSRVSLEPDGKDGQVFRMYQAAFNRKPDLKGLGYWFAEMDKGTTLAEVAQSFINSPEFSKTYGSLTDSQFVTQLYQNVLQRVPDNAGLSYHVANLTSGTPRAQVLVGFSESPENQVALIGVIKDGIDYQL